MKNRILTVVAGVALLGVGIFIGSVGTRAARAEGAGALADGQMAAMHAAMETGDVEAMKTACEGFMASEEGQEMHAGMMDGMMNGTGMMDGMMQGEVPAGMQETHQQHHGLGGGVAPDGTDGN